MLNHPMFSTDESELNHMGYSLRVGERVLWKYKAQLGKKLCREVWWFPWDMWSKKKAIQ